MLNYVNRVIVGDSDGLVNTGDALSNITRGDILILDENMTVLTGTPAKQSFYVAVGTGFAESPFILSSKINPDKVTSSADKGYVAGADQVSTIGIATPAIGDSVNVVIAFKDRLRLIANKQTRMVLSAIAETTDPYDLASDLAKQAKFSSPYSDPYGVQVDVLATGTPTYLTLTEDVTVTKGSTSISYAADPGFSAGDIISIRGIAYKLVSSDASEGVLDRAYTGASETIDVSAEATAVGSLASITAVDLQVSGLTPPFQNPEIDLYEKVQFTLGSDQDGQVETVVTAATLGNGTYEQVKRMEYDVQGYLGNTNLRQWPIPSFDYHAVAGTGYDVIQIQAFDEHEGDLQGQMKSPVGVTIAFATGSAQRDAVDTILESVLGVAAFTYPTT